MEYTSSHLTSIVHMELIMVELEKKLNIPIYFLN